MELSRWGSYMKVDRDLTIDCDSIVVKNTELFNLLLLGVADLNSKIYGVARGVINNIKSRLIQMSPIALPQQVSNKLPQNPQTLL
ncbi:MAG: hypothetical protein H0U49_03820 [Parachlamydiaceae bacterium]|nr:hypothetical protein [Parachlamydiaceae bacterium]